MADERRILGALERLRLHGTSSQQAQSTIDQQTASDTFGAVSHAAWRDVDATPPRRKSSALTLSHLTPATPARGDVPPAIAEAPSPFASDAVRDIARELEAVEARLSVFRQHRETPATAERAEPAPVKETPVKETPPLLPGVVADSKNLDTEASSTSAKPPVAATQQAGEVADEVEHALANCDRLLQQAKLQASAASLTRSLRSGSGPRPPLGSSTRHATLMRPPYAVHDNHDRSVADTSDPSSFSASAAFPEVRKASFSGNDELELEATARAMKAIVASHEREMEREEAAVREQNLLTQTNQLKEMERKFESKKRMMLLSLREKCEAETRALIKQAIATQEESQREAIAKIEGKMLADREQMLNTILVRHQADTVDHVKRIQVRLQAETLTQKQDLEKHLQQELEDTIGQLEQETEVELRRWEQKQRLGMETDVLKRREQAAMAILRAQELKTNELKQQMLHQHEAKEVGELEKLKKALAFGAQAQLQQLRKQLDGDHERKMSDTRTEAAQALENKLTDLKQVLKLAHKQELEQTQRDLEKRHRVAVMEMHEQLEMHHRAQVTELTTKAAEELEATLESLRKELILQNKAKLEALQQTMDRDHRVRMHQLEMENERECETALERQRQDLTEQNQRELDAKVARMQQSKAALLDEAVLFLAISPEERSAASGGTNTTEGLLQLKQLNVHLPTQLQRAVATLVRDFEELTEEQQILVEKISDSTGLYLTFKRQCGQLDSEVNELRSAIQVMHSQLQSKDDLAKKLYMANEALLKKLGIADTLQ